MYDTGDLNRLDCGTSHFLSSYSLGAQGKHWSRENHVLIWGQATDTILWMRARQPTPVLLSGESHGQRSLVDYSPWGHRESNTTEQLTRTQNRYNGNSKTGCGLQEPAIWVLKGKETDWGCQGGFVITGSLGRFAKQCASPASIIFNQRTTALQCCVDFCHTSTWISRRYSHVPSVLNLLPLPIPLVCYTAPGWVPCTQGTWVQLPITNLFYKW